MSRVSELVMRAGRVATEQALQRALSDAELKLIAALTEEECASRQRWAQSSEEERALDVGKAVARRIAGEAHKRKDSIRKKLDSVTGVEFCAGR